MRRLHPLFLLVIFQLGFSGIPENHEKNREIVPRRSIPPDPVLGPFFVTFFLKKFRFSLQGLVRVQHLVLARTRDDFGATLPGGSI